jgi:hypothetical protein
MDARAAMLVADRTSLRGDDQSDLARHVHECAECRGLALGIESDTALLAFVLAAGAKPADVAPAVERRRVRRAGPLVLAALPVAATIAFMMLHRSEGRAGHRPSLRARTDRVAMNTVSVDVAPGQTATVMRTQDPKVTIVWISPGGTE